MKDTDLFQLAMGFDTSVAGGCSVRLTKSKAGWTSASALSEAGTFVCPECGRAGCKAYDTEERTWRHLKLLPV